MTTTTSSRKIKTVRYADLFAGIGGFALAFQKALPGRTAWVYGCDNDQRAAATYKANFGHAILQDITKVDFGTLPDCDLVLGGFPCQPFSRNGLHYNRGRDSTVGKSSLRIQNPKEQRHHLFQYLVRFLRVKRPARFLFENVKGLESMRNVEGRSYLDIIRSAFSSCGYTVYTAVLDSADYGLPQQRRRLLFAGFRTDIFGPKEHMKFCFPPGVPRTSCVRDILELRTDPRYRLSNLWRNRICRRLVDASGNRLTRLQALANARLPDSNLPTRPTGRIEPISIIYGDTPSGGPRQMDKLYSVLGISPTIATFSTPAFATEEAWRILTPRECARLQGFPDDFELPKSDSAAYKQIGNAISVNTVAAVLRAMF